MIREATGNLLDIQADALVNTVNTVGVMGKGIALQFKRAFPSNFVAYEKACKTGEIQPGKMFIFETKELSGPRYIINFPTKRHWRGSSRMEDIETGLNALVANVKQLKIHSIAVPPLGCGSGGLAWKEVCPRIITAFADLPDVEVLLFAPSGEPSPEQMTNRTTRPHMTPTMAAILGILGHYAKFDYRLSLLEVHKLVYFLKESGEAFTRTTFAKGPYGPYADNLRHVLNRLEGHYLKGFGDATKNKPETSIWLLPDAKREAEEFLNEQPITRERFGRVIRLIEGFETPYGMELLSTIHWIATRENQKAKEEFTAVIAEVHQWSTCKARLFKETHVHVAWEKLREQKWI